MMNDETKLHNLRIRLKRMRYVCEAMPTSPYYDTNLIEQIKETQSILGKIQDAEETMRLLKEWGVGSEKTMVRLVNEKKAAKTELPVAAASLLNTMNGYIKQPLFFG
jgi:CHAD domain-containing protein